MNPIDTILFTALLHKMGNSIELMRKQVAQPHLVYSYRFDGQGGCLFKTDASYMKFQANTLSVNTTEYPYMVCADITDFFNRISLHHLENALRGMDLNDEARILSTFLLSLSGGLSCGIPVGTAAARLLSEVILHGVDVTMCLTPDDIIYTRYNDDFRIFCKTVGTAHSFTTANQNHILRNWLHVATSKNNDRQNRSIPKRLAIYQQFDWFVS